MRVLFGKGLWLQRLSACEQGDLAVIVARAAAAGLSHVIVKVADGADLVNAADAADAAEPADPALALTERLTQAGIDVWGWQSLYGDRPAFKGGFVDAYHQHEAQTAADRVQVLRAAGLRGLVLEARGEYERIPERARKAAEFMRQLRARWPDLPLALSSWRAPAAHPRFPWAEFRQSCDLDLPQVFWTGQHGVATRSLEAALRQFTALEPARPLAAAGPGFFEANWRPAPSDLAEFVETAARLGLSAVNLWLWDQLGLSGAEPDNPAHLDFRPHWDAFAAAAWPGAPARQPVADHELEAPAAAQSPAAVLSSAPPGPSPDIAFEAETGLAEAGSGPAPDFALTEDWAEALPAALTGEALGSGPEASFDLPADWAEAPIADELPEALAAALAETLAETSTPENELPEVIDSATLDDLETPAHELWAELVGPEVEVPAHLAEAAAEEPDLGASEALEPAVADALADYLEAADDAPAAPLQAVPDLPEFEAPPWLRPPLEAAEAETLETPAPAIEETGTLWAAALAQIDSREDAELPEWLREHAGAVEDAEAEAPTAWPEPEPADDELPEWLQIPEDQPLPPPPAPAPRIFVTTAPASTAPPANVVAFFKALRQSQLEAALARYAPGFAHVTAERVTHQTAEVRAFYAALLTEGRAAGLAVQASRGTPPLVHVRWLLPAGDDAWRCFEDEFHLNRAGKIVYHRTVAVP